MRSPMTSRSNCAKDNRTLRVKRPIDVVVLNCCVTDTKDAPLASRISTILSRAQAHPAFVPLAVDEGLAGFALRLQRIELLFEPLLGRLAGVDRTADGSGPPHCGSRFFHWLA